MQYGHWENRYSGDFERYKRLDFEQIQLWFAASGLRLPKAVREDVAQMIQNLDGAIDGDTLLVHKIKLSEIVHSKNMVGVNVGHQDRIHVINVLPKYLRAQIRCCVYKNRTFLSF